MVIDQDMLCQLKNPLKVDEFPQEIGEQMGKTIVGNFPIGYDTFLM